MIATKIKSTDALEAELAALSNKITNAANQLTDDKSLFETIRVELKNRRAEKDEQPPPDIRPATREAALELKNEHLSRENKVLILKITEMESEQAKLVIEIQLANFARQQAEERLALVAKHIKPESWLTPAKID